jgi:hypothetical protein
MFLWNVGRVRYQRLVAGVVDHELQCQPFRILECQRALGLTAEEIVSLVRNGFTAAFISPAECAAALAKVDKYVSEFNWSH